MSEDKNCARRVLLDLDETKRKIEDKKRELVTLRAELEKANMADDDHLISNLWNQIRRCEVEIETLRETYRQLEKAFRLNPIQATKTGEGS